MRTEEIYRYALAVEGKANYPMETKECLRLAVNNVVPVDELNEIYCLFNIDYEQIISDLVNGYINYKEKLKCQNIAK